MAVAPPHGRLRWQFATLVETIIETPRVKTLVLDVPDWPGHKPGQHVDVRLTSDDGYQAERSYSIASPPQEPRLTLTVERLAEGEVSPYLSDELRPGDKLELRGPIGGYFTWTTADGGPLLLVGGGSGVVPLMAMLRHRAAAGANLPALLLASWRSHEEIIYRAELERMAAADSALKIIHTLTRSQPAGWTGYTRRIDRQMLQEVSPPPAEQPRIYVCGPTALVETVATSFVALGHAPQNVRTERFGPTG